MVLDTVKSRLVVPGRELEDGLQLVLNSSGIAEFECFHAIFKKKLPLSAFYLHF